MELGGECGLFNGKTSATSVSFLVSTSTEQPFMKLDDMQNLVMGTLVRTADNATYVLMECALTGNGMESEGSQSQNPTLPACQV